MQVTTTAGQASSGTSNLNLDTALGAVEFKLFHPQDAYNRFANDCKVLEANGKAVEKMPKDSI
jgi:hypothetical protein